MKKFIQWMVVVAGLVVVVGHAVAQSPSESGAELQWTKQVIQLGTLQQGADASGVFVFKNTGNQPLIITSIASSCACLTAQWDKAPVLPGQHGRIKLTYDSQRLGPINKGVTVHSNATNMSRSTLVVKGNIDPPAQTAPAKPAMGPAAPAP